MSEKNIKNGKPENSFIKFINENSKIIFIVFFLSLQILILVMQSQKGQELDTKISKLKRQIIKTELEDRELEFQIEQYVNKNNIEKIVQKSEVYERIKFEDYVYFPYLEINN